MASVDLRALVGKLSPAAQTTLQSAAGMALSRHHRVVEPEHHLLQMIESSPFVFRPHSDVDKILDYFAFERQRLIDSFQRRMVTMPRDHPKTPALSSGLVYGLKEGATLALVRGATRIRTGYLFEAYLQSPDLAGVCREVNLTQAHFDQLGNSYLDIVAGSEEEITSMRPSGRAAKPDIFISYRRNDSIGYVHAIYWMLAEHFGLDRVFLDLEKLDPGVNFVSELHQGIEHAKVMVAIIGDRWLDPSAEGEQPRVWHPRDYVHREIRFGVDSAIDVIPVLVGRAEMPSRDRLPPPLGALADINAVRILDAQFRASVMRLISAINRSVTRDLKPTF